MLQYRLQHTFPYADIEVINTGLTAINSFTLVDFAKAIVRESPDAIIMYAGHNEYYGTLGVGSNSKLANAPWMVRTLLKARDLRIVQFTLHLGQIFKGKASKVDLSETLMQRMAQDQRILYGSKKYTQGIKQFEDNLDLILKQFNKKRIPVFLATLVSNLKDQPPMLASQQTASHHDKNVLASLVAQDTAKAIALLQKAIAADETNAVNHYKLAQLLADRGHLTEARVHYVAAKEYDPLRFRAPEAINEIIKKKVEKWDNVRLVDIQEIFNQKSEGGIPGNNLFLEHLHPNAHGYYQIAEAFACSLHDAKMIASEWPIATSHEGDFSDSETFWNKIPFTRVDSLYGLYQTWMLKEQWPFNQPMPPAEDRDRTFEEKIAGGLSVKTIEWGEGMNAMYEHYLKSGDLDEAMKITESLILEFPFDMRLYDRVGSLSEKIGNTERAFFYYKKAFDIQPSGKWAEKVFITGLKLDKSEEVVKYMEFAIKNNNGRWILDHFWGWWQK
ncbi:MAG: hypothetical protein HC819_01635 [Cyclobacteriaceae bacterium]|nr:hypothetical protein [Cyclobacteriaceae bacterium]